MGLQEKRIIKKFQEEKFPAFEKRIKELAGDNTEIEVHWDTLAVEETANFLEEALEKIYFTSTIEAFEEIAIDNLGIEALENVLTKIIITNSEENYFPKSAYSFDNKVLTINHKLNSNIDDVDDRKEYLVIMLMNNME